MPRTTIHIPVTNMKKQLYIIIVLVLILSISGCVQTSDPMVEETLPIVEEPKPSDTKPEPRPKPDPEPPYDVSAFIVTGKYICLSDYYNEDVHRENPYVPYVSFYDEDKCLLYVNYFEGITIVSGTYIVSGSQINATMNFEGTIFLDNETAEKYLPTKYVFSIINDDEIVIDKDCYGVYAGDSFFRSGNASVLLTNPIHIPDDFLYGEWSVNQLIKKYGTPKTAKATRWSGWADYSGDVDVSVEFADISVFFRNADLSIFSFKDDDFTPVDELEYMEYDINNDDRNIKLIVKSLTISDKTLEFPQGIKIGESTKADVLDVHPEEDAIIFYETREEYGVRNFVLYDYGFLYEVDKKADDSRICFGHVVYRFGETDVLKSVDIFWG